MVFPSTPPIDGFGPGFFRIGGKVFHGPSLILPDRIGKWGGLDDAASILEAAGSIDLVLIGTGLEISPIPDALEGELRAAGIFVEAIATPSACRTYNVLLSEERRLAAALLPLPAVAKG